MRVPEAWESGVHEGKRAECYWPQISLRHRDRRDGRSKACYGNSGWCVLRMLEFKRSIVRGGKHTGVNQKQGIWRMHELGKHSISRRT